MLAYYEICSASKETAFSDKMTFKSKRTSFLVKENALTLSPGTPSRGPYAYSTTGLWVGYDDVETIKKKSRFLIDNGYGGAAVWALDLDDFNNICCGGISPLLNAASQALRGKKSSHKARIYCEIKGHSE